MSTILNRTTFTTNRMLEFFSEKELQMQIGHSRANWPVVLVKELIDNALDACEQAGIAPEITITVEPDAVSVQDNGPGLPAATLKKSLDYLVRVSDKSHYVSPTRGQLGNALKCVWAAPFVIDGEHGCVEVTTGGVQHTIDVRLDRIAGQPKIDHTTSPDGFVKTGTLVKMHWPRIAGYLTADHDPRFYKLMDGYTYFNPHATFIIRTPDATQHIEATDPTWRKWKPHDPTSPHWYTVDRLRALITAYLSDELAGGRARTVREFVAEFNGLSGTQKQKAVTDAAGLSGMYLHDLIKQDEVDIAMTQRLLSAMQQAAKVIKPAALGVIGEAHIRQRMTARSWIDSDSIQYKRVADMNQGVPFVLEVAFGINTPEYEDCGSTIWTGINWSPTLDIPFNELFRLLGEVRVDRHDPVAMVIHLATPNVQFSNKGKTHLEL
jgi:DNA topoisomerase VI subunit B